MQADAGLFWIMVYGNFKESNLFCPRRELLAKEGRLALLSGLAGVLCLSVSCHVLADWKISEQEH